MMLVLLLYNASRNSTFPWKVCFLLFVRIPYFCLINVDRLNLNVSMFKFDLFSFATRYLCRQFLLDASSLVLGTTDWNLQNPDSVFMGSMRILSISTWTQVSE